MTQTSNGHAFQGEQRLYQIVVRRLARMIDDNRDDPNWRFPGERDLAELLEVSRPVIREAVIALEVQGLVTVKGRSGISVLPQPPVETGTAMAIAADVDLFHLLEARKALEPSMAMSAAHNPSDTDLALLESYVARMATGDAERFAEASHQFQVSIARISGNPVLIAMAETLQAAWHNSSILHAIRETLFSSAMRPLWIGDQHAILTALRMRQPEAAARAVRRHFDNLESEAHEIMSDNSDTVTRAEDVGKDQNSDKTGEDCVSHSEEN